MYNYRHCIRALIITSAICAQFAATSALVTCPGRPDVEESWSSSNVGASGCTLNPASNHNACNFSPTIDTEGVQTVPNGTSCTASLSCLKNGTPLASASDVLTYDPSLVWNGLSCVLPSNLITVTLDQFSPSTISVGESATFSFTSTRAAWCSGEGLVEGDLGGTSATISTGIISTAGTYTQRVICGNGILAPAASAIRTLIVTLGAFTSTPSCTIALGSSSCTSPISWTTADITTAVLTDCSGGVYTSTGVGAQTYNTPGITIPYNTGCYQLHNETATGALLDTVNGTAVCEAGSGWNGSICAATVSTFPSNTCTIPENQDTCTMPITWSVINPSGTVSIKKPYDSNNVLTGTQGVNVGTVNPTFTPPGTYQMDLYDGVTILKSASFTVSCADGSGWSWSTKTCIKPVANLTLSNNYASPGTLTATCTNSSSYAIVRVEDGVVIASGAYGTNPINQTVTVTGNYRLICTNTFGGTTIDSTPAVRIYTSTPPSPTISLHASPATVQKGANSVISWAVNFPIASCSIAAKAVCAGGVCSDEQRASETTLNNTFATGRTDANDPNGPNRLITKAVNGTDLTPVVIKTQGQKTLKINNTTDFEITCTPASGPAIHNKVRVNVTSSVEG
jgi:hypothetical protein